MAEVAVYVSANKDILEDFNTYVRYMFAASMKEISRQNSADISCAVVKGEALKLVRSSSPDRLSDIMDYFFDQMDAAGLLPVDMGVFDIIIDYDANHPTDLDLALEFAMFVLSVFSSKTKSLIAFTVHPAQNGEDGFEPPHMHVMWQMDDRSESELPDFIISEFSE